MKMIFAIRSKRFVDRLLFLLFFALIGLIFFYLSFPCIFSTEHPSWPSTAPRNLSFYIHPERDTMILTPDDRCEPSLDLLIIIHSGTNNQEARISIRQTWASKEHINSLNASVRVVFLLGQTDNHTLTTLIVDEAKKYGDIIQEKFNDTYHNLIIKSGMMLKWATTHCHQATYLMKTDDDIFVTLPNLLKALPPRPMSSEIILGPLVSGQIPILNSYDRWYTPKYMYSKNTFPDFVSGTGYLMSMDVASKLYNATLSTPMIVLEDVYITGLCAEKAGVRPVNHPGFSFISRKFNICLPEDSITAHEVNTCMMYAIWNRTRNSKKSKIPCLLQNGRTKPMEQPMREFVHCFDEI